MQNIYLDNAATTMIAPEVVEEMIPYLGGFFGNPSSVHQHGRQVKAEVEKARRKVAKLLGAEPSELFFTSGGTEADNIALRCIAKTDGIVQLISSRIEHHAVSHTIEQVARELSLPLHWVNLDPQGQVDYAHLEELLSNGNKSLVSLMHGNNEIGNLLDLQQVSALVKKYGARFHCDSVQTIGHFPIDLKSLEIHALAASAHKFHGPKGVGILYLKKGCKIDPMVTGGSQERGMRPGTENVAGIMGFAKALELAVSEMDHHAHHIKQLKQRMIQGLEKAIPGIRFNGRSGHIDDSLYTVLSVGFPPSDANDMLLFQLDLNGVSASGGSACSSGASAGSHVMTALRTDPAWANIRFSFSRFNTLEEIDQAVARVKKSVAPTPHHA